MRERETEREGIGDRERGREKAREGGRNRGRERQSRKVHVYLHHPPHAVHANWGVYIYHMTTVNKPIYSVHCTHIHVAVYIWITVYVLYLLI